MNDNEKSRKYQLTINNPLEKGFDHAEINKRMEDIKYLYYCLCDETGEQGTPHTHIYFVCENAMFFSRVKKLFPEAHIEAARGLNCENRDYIRKEGKYADSEKKETNHIETFEEYGELPLDKSAKNETVSEKVLTMVEEGFSNTEIIKAFPSYGTKIPHLDRLRTTLLEDKYKNCWRDLEIQYIYGDSETGKTSSIMNGFGYSNVYKITNYQHPFDAYQSQDVMLFDEFSSSLPINDFLQYLDGYPCRLPARYGDKIACYTKVFIISNIPLEKQYIDIQNEHPKTWNAFIRRLTSIFCFESNSQKETIKTEMFKENYLV